MKKRLMIFIFAIVYFIFPFQSIDNTAQAQTKWGKIILEDNMIGKVQILKDAYQYSIINNKLKSVVKLKKGKEYGVYSYSKKFGGIYKIGTNKYVKKNSLVVYVKKPRNLKPIEENKNTKPPVTLPIDTKNTKPPVTLPIDTKNSIPPVLEVSGFVDRFETNINTLQLMVKTEEGALVNVTLNGISVKGENKYLLNLTKEGNNIVEVTSSKQGLTSKRVLNVIYDITKPLLKIDKIKSETVRESVYRFSIETEENSKVDVIQNKTKKEGTEQVVNGIKRIEYELLLNKDDNLVSILAYDNVGNTNYYGDYNIVYKPKLTIQDVKTSIDLETYLNENYSTLDTPVGVWKFKYGVLGNPSYLMSIKTGWSGGSPYTLRYDDNDLEILEYERDINEEEKIITKRLLRQRQKEVADVAMFAFPNSIIEGGFSASGYKYRYLKVGYWDIKFLEWNNYYKEFSYSDRVLDEFKWTPRLNDYNFVTDKMVEKIYVVDEQTGQRYSDDDRSITIKIKTGDSIKFEVAPDMDISGLDYKEIGLSYTYSDYSKKNIIMVDKNGVIRGNNKGEQSVSVSYEWNPYASLYFTVIVE